MWQQNDTKQKILTAAVELFAKSGYDGVSIRTLSSAVDIKESSFYNHFKSKAQLLDTIFDDFVKRVSALGAAPQLDEIIRIGSLEEILMAPVEHFVTFWTMPEMVKMWYVVSNEQYKNERAAKIIIDISQAVLKRTESLHAHLQSIGKMRKCDYHDSACMFAYGIRAIHLEWNLRYCFNMTPEYSYRTIKDFVKHFASMYSL